MLLLVYMLYFAATGLHKKCWHGFSVEAFRDWPIVLKCDRSDRSELTVHSRSARVSLTHVLLTLCSRFRDLFAPVLHVLLTFHSLLFVDQAGCRRDNEHDGHVVELGDLSG